MSRSARTRRFSRITPVLRPRIARASLADICAPAVILEEQTGVILDANAAALTHFGQPLAELQSRFGQDLEHADVSDAEAPWADTLTRSAPRNHAGSWRRIPALSKGRSVELWVLFPPQRGLPEIDDSLDRERLAIAWLERTHQSHRSPKELAAHITDILIGILGFDDAAVLIIQPLSGTLEHLAWESRLVVGSTTDRRRSPIPLDLLRVGIGITGWVAQSGESVRLGDVRTDARYLPLRSDIVSELCVPLTIDDRILGVLNVESTRPDAFGQQLQSILEVIASQIAFAVEHRQVLYGLERELLARRQSEEQAAASQSLLQSVTDNSSALIYALDLQGRFLLVNQRLEKLFNASRDNLIGQTREVVLPPDLSAEHRANDLQVIAQDAPIVTEEVNDELDGRHTYLTTKFPLRDVKGRIFGVGGVSTDITDRRRKERELESVVVVSAALRKVQTRAEMLHIILRELVRFLDATGAACALQEQGADHATIEFAIGSFAPQVLQAVALGEGVWGRVMLTGQVLSDDAFVPDRQGDGRLPGVKAHALVCAPLIARDQTIGALWVERESPFLSDDISLMVAVADIAANAIHRITLHTQVLQDAVELEQAYDTTIEGWSRALELRDRETKGHSLRVTELTVKLARAAGMSDSELVHVRRGALLHDIGKMGIPDSILHKPGELTTDEWELMRLHPAYAYDLLSPIVYLRTALDIPYCHHEKWDGSGYPRGLSGEQIPLAARLFAAADVWDALRFDRPYRKALQEADATAHIRSLSGTHLDPWAVALFLAVIGAESETRPAQAL